MPSDQEAHAAREALAGIAERPSDKGIYTVPHDCFGMAKGYLLPDPGLSPNYCYIKNGECEHVHPELCPLHNQFFGSKAGVERKYDQRDRR